MSHPDWEGIGTIEDRLMEECAELIKEICKIKRFGYFNTYKDNIAAVESEMRDVEKLLAQYKEYLFQLKYVNSYTPRT